MIVTPFISKDYMEIAEGWCVGDPAALGAQYAQHPGYTARSNGVLVACAGVVVKPWGTSGEAWAIFAPTAAQEPFVYRHIKQGLYEIIQRHKLVRVEASVRAGFMLGERLIMKLGFAFEAEMPKWGPDGSDFNKFVLFPRMPARLVRSEAAYGR